MRRYIEPFLGGGAVLLHLRGAEPFLRWAGGKRRLLPQILQRMHKASCQLKDQPLGIACDCFNFSDYIGADVNPHLIAAYTSIQDNVVDVITWLKAQPRSREDYDTMRDMLYPSNRGAWAIWLNCFAFNGLWRVNSKGVFNAPPDPRLLSHLDLDVVATKLRQAAHALATVRLQCSSYIRTLSLCGHGDVVYCDPPYLPDEEEKSKSTFVSYVAKTESARDMHERLACEVASTARRGALIVVSNSCAAEPLYQSSDFQGLVVKIDHVTVRSNFNANSRRGKREELLITIRGE